MTDCLIVIPARLKATRLPDKPLADIARRAHDRACLAPRRRGRLRARGGGHRRRGGARRGPARWRQGLDDTAQITQAAPTGCSRRSRNSIPRASSTSWSICKAICRRSTLAWCEAALPRLRAHEADIGTIAAAIPRRRKTPTLTWLRWWAPRSKGGQALSRALFHPRHRPIWRGTASTIISASTPIGGRLLQRFVALPPSPLELREKLEQLRGARGRHAHPCRPR